MPPKPVIGVPFGLVASFNLVFIAFIDVGSVGRPTIKAKQRPGRDIFGTISSDAVITTMPDGVVVGAPDVDRSCAPLASGHQVR